VHDDWSLIELSGSLLVDRSFTQDLPLPAPLGNKCLAKITHQLQAPSDRTRTPLPSPRPSTPPKQPPFHRAALPSLMELQRHHDEAWFSLGLLHVRASAICLVYFVPLRSFVLSPVCYHYSIPATTRATSRATTTGYSETAQFLSGHPLILSPRLGPKGECRFL